MVSRRSEYFQRAKRNASLSQRRLCRRVFNQVPGNVLVSVWSATKKDRRPTVDAERVRTVGRVKGRAGDVGGDANSAFNKVSRGCHLNIVAYSLFSLSPRGGVGKRMTKRMRDGDGVSGKVAKRKA